MVFSCNTFTHCVDGQDHSIITSHFFLYFLTHPPLSQVVTFDYPSENYVTLIHPPKTSKKV